jgi:hypothetical protein
VQLVPSRAGKHWLVTQPEPETGKVVFHHGGTYTLDGDSYVETIEYATENTADQIKKTYKFKGGQWTRLTFPLDLQEVLDRKRVLRWHVVSEMTAPVRMLRRVPSPATLSETMLSGAEADGTRPTGVVAASE